ncbi:integrase catalytic domain-containing protein, partial [Heyndrickxia coagulans]|uniref:integrase catalytic domain-containing protein n=1 Tax=Heyndrickxia coagulans TaxID=1398 RepID=UPI00214D492F|nr:transposase family protein [Heyndrickxia coagulans]
MDIIGKIYLTLSKGHNFILVATDYLTKWVEAVPLKKVGQEDIIQFIKEHIIHRFGIPQSVTTDQGTMFTGDEITYFAKDYNIKLL